MSGVSIDALPQGLKLMRQMKGMSLRDLEEVTGVSASTLVRIERGSDPSVGVLRHLADWFGIPIIIEPRAPTGVRTAGQ